MTQICPPTSLAVDRSAQGPTGWRRARLPLFIALWLASAAGGSVVLLQFGSRPGPAGPPVLTWPAASSLPRNSDVHTLVVALHPKCPCSRATVRELERLAAACAGRLQFCVLLLRPDGATGDWEHTSLGDAARDLPRSTVVADPAGVEAARFGALTSGHVALYDPRGTLRFTGGVTPARGHAGDNPGSRAIRDLVNGRAAAAASSASAPSTPVFGCPLASTVPQAPRAGKADDVVR